MTRPIKPIKPLAAGIYAVQVANGTPVATPDDSTLEEAMTIAVAVAEGNRGEQTRLLRRRRVTGWHVYVELWRSQHEGR